MQGNVDEMPVEFLRLLDSVRIVTRTWSYDVPSFIMRFGPRKGKSVSSADPASPRAVRARRPILTAADFAY